MKDKSLALLAVIVSAILAGGVGTVIKIGLKTVPPMTYTFFRFLIASLFIVPLFIRQKPKLHNLRDMVFISLLSTTNIILFVYGIKLTSVNVSQMLYLTVPITVTVFSIFILKEKLNKFKIAGIVTGLTGSLFLIGYRPAGGNSGPQPLLGNLMILAGATSYAFFLIYSKKLQKNNTAIAITTVFNLTTMVVALILSFSDFVVDPGWWRMLTPVSYISVIYVGVMATAVYYLLSQYAIRHGSPAVASITLYLQPIFTFVWSFFLLGEMLTANFILSALLVFAGAYLASL